MQTLRARPILAFLVAILALLALTGMVYALGRLTGFIPGFGFTSNTGVVYVLAEPVESTRAASRCAWTMRSVTIAVSGQP